MAFVNNRLALTLPLDISGLDAPHMACSCARRLISSYTGPLVRLRRESDNVEQDIGQKAGHLNYEEAYDFVGGGEAQCVTVYDQSGNGWHLAESTAANQPAAYDGRWLKRGGFPTIQVGAGAQRLRVATDNASNNGCVALATYINQLPGLTGFLFDDYNSVGDWSAQLDSSGNLYTETDGYAAVDTGFDMPNGSRYVLVCNFESTNRHRVLLDGVVSDFNYGATGTADGMNVGINGSGSYPQVHSFHEIIWYNSQLSDALLDTLSANLNAYYKVY